jgi:hypothetical protein
MVVLCLSRLDGDREETFCFALVLGLNRPDGDCDKPFVLGLNRPDGDGDREETLDLVFCVSDVN